jgi:hypothetical protein
VKPANMVHEGSCEACSLISPLMENEWKKLNGK